MPQRRRDDRSHVSPMIMYQSSHGMPFVLIIVLKRGIPWSFNRCLFLLSFGQRLIEWITSPGKEKTWRRMDSCSWRAVFCLPSNGAWQRSDVLSEPVHCPEDVSLLKTGSGMTEHGINDGTSDPCPRRRSINQSLDRELAVERRKERQCQPALLSGSKRFPLPYSFWEPLSVSLSPAFFFSETHEGSSL